MAPQRKQVPLRGWRVSVHQERQLDRVDLPDLQPVDRNRVGVTTVAFHPLFHAIVLALLATAFSLAGDWAGWVAIAMVAGFSVSGSF